MGETAGSTEKINAERSRESTESNKPTSESNGPAAQGQPSSVSPEQRVQELERESKEKENKYLYLYAEFENFKKRVVRERSDLIKFGWEAVARDLLQVLDNLERAIAHTPENTDKGLMTGIKMVFDQFRSTLERQGVQPIEAVGRDFDPNLHEAVGQLPSEQPSGKVIQEQQKGYLLHGRLLRPSRVVISSGVKS